MNFKSQDVESVHLAEMSKVDNSIDWKSDEQRWQKIMTLRDEVLRALEGLRQKKDIASNQQASVTINSGDSELIEVLNGFGVEAFAALCIVSEVKFETADGETTVAAERSGHQKCERCWNYWTSVGRAEKYPDLCQRCAEAVGACYTALD